MRRRRDAATERTVPGLPRLARTAEQPVRITRLVVVCVGVVLYGLLPMVVQGQNANDRGSGLTIACSTTQIADFTRQIVGDRCQVRCVLAPGQDPHMFEVTQDAVAIVQSADLCLDNGLYLEGGDWMRTVAVQESKSIRSCTEGLPPIKLEQHGEKVSDPHAWFSPMNASRYYITNICDAVCQLDPDHAAEYQARREYYREQLRALHVWAQRQFNRVPPDRRVLVTSHDAFNYLCQTYQLTPRSPVGWSTEEVGGEMSQSSRQAVIDSIRQAEVPAVFLETSVNPKAIEDIAREANVRIGGKLYSDSMGPSGSAGETYLGMMRENIITIVSALSAESPQAASDSATPAEPNK